MGRYSVKRYKTKRRTKDLDLVEKDLSTNESISKLLNQPLDETKPGLGQFYCIHCAKYCETSYALKTHLKTKIHKRRLKDLKFGAHTQDRADASAGVNLNNFMNRVKQLQDNKEIQSQRETHLKNFLDDSLKNANGKEPTLPMANLNETKLVNDNSV